ncbi:hypothetical protein ACH5RR_026464 [Cinchona calisaya]|uniref:DUF4283 domain-containing protein n=1 Tax=Cinchona calisaya TaxID=153742 RepID=A0ABD2Z2N1_9GENT
MLLKSCLIYEDSIPTIQLFKEDKARIKQPFMQTIIAKVIGKNVGFKFFDHKVREMWKIKGTMSIVALGGDYFAVKFMKEQDFVKIISGGPWFINRNYFSVRLCEPNFSPSRANCPQIAMRVRLLELPLEYYETEMLTQVRNMLGKLLKIDVKMANSERGRFANHVKDYCNHSTSIPESNKIAAEYARHANGEMGSDLDPNNQKEDHLFSPWLVEEEVHQQGKDISKSLDNGEKNSKVGQFESVLSAISPSARDQAQLDPLGEIVSKPETLELQSPKLDYKPAEPSNSKQSPKVRINRKKIGCVSTNSSNARKSKQGTSTLSKLISYRKQTDDHIRAGRNNVVQQICASLLSKDERNMGAYHLHPGYTEIKDLGVKERNETA